jgi:hypothetical protein
MDLESFKASLSARRSPAAGRSPLLRALWLDGKGDFDGAHANRARRGRRDGRGARLPASQRGRLLQRGYWYRRARQKPFEGSLSAEWEALVQRFL